MGTALVGHYSSLARNVLALDRDEHRLAALASLPGVITRSADLTSETDIAKALEAIPAVENIGLLVNAVGEIWNEPVLALRGGRFAAHAVESLARVIAANLTAPIAVANAVAARMARSGGAIVNFGSVSAAGNVGQVAYSAAKAGLEAASRSMAAELGPLGIRVNTMALGFIDIASTRAAVPEKQLNVYAARTPLGRLGQLQDVFDALAFLEASSFVTGETLRVDGGLRL